ncbi:MAG: hypothetical protein PUF31_09950 [Oscillospiraceae bacterium]|nr:hypothetical protein [Oscillospiraceae bacterium]
MKKKWIAVLLVAVILIGSVVALYFSKLPDTVLWLIASRNTASEKEQFSRLEDDYEAVVRYLMADVMQKYPEEEYICLGVDSNQYVYAEDGTRHKEKLVVSIVTDADEDNIDLKPGEKIMQSFDRINTSFMQMDYSLDAIRIRDGKISFDVIDGRYSLVYELSRSELEKVRNNSFRQTNGLTGKWRHQLS